MKFVNFFIIAVIAGVGVASASNSIMDAKLVGSELARAVFLEGVWGYRARMELGDSIFTPSGPHVISELHYEVSTISGRNAWVLRLIKSSPVQVENFGDSLSFYVERSPAAESRVWTPLNLTTKRPSLNEMRKLGVVSISMDAVRNAAEPARNKNTELVVNWLRNARRHGENVGDIFAIFRCVNSDRVAYAVALDRKELLAIPENVFTDGALSDDILLASYRESSRSNFSGGSLAATEGGIIDLQTAVANCIIFGDIVRIEVNDTSQPKHGEEVNRTTKAR